MDLICKTCGRSFSRADSLHRHIMSVHRTAKQAMYSTKNHIGRGLEVDLVVDKRESDDESSDDCTEITAMSNAALSLVQHALHLADVGRQ